MKTQRALEKKKKEKANPTIEPWPNRSVAGVLQAAWSIHNLHTNRVVPPTAAKEMAPRLSHCVCVFFLFDCWICSSIIDPRMLSKIQKRKNHIVQQRCEKETDEWASNWQPKEKEGCQYLDRRMNGRTVSWPSKQSMHEETNA